ncbi:MAG: hypothetical protein K0S41_1309 [Anaerocolumna sp.]|jgi:hypothetical protein|nr:hypothetical protein [Anaerocolumna sp.]
MILVNANTVKEIYLKALKDMWNKTCYQFPNFLSETSNNNKADNEVYILAMFDNFQKQFNRFPRLPLRRKKWVHKTKLMFHDFFCNETFIGIHQTMDDESINNLQEELTLFLKQVRVFAPELSFYDIGQAIRNYIVYIMFKEMNGIKTGFSMSGFSYSMLYPVTDNYIDNKDYTATDKKEYNQIIRDKIAGNKVYPKSIHHKKTCELLQAIEDDYPREKDLTIFHLLQMMLEAQVDSLKQQEKEIVLTETERLDISLYKGGVSVLIDRYLINKELTPDDMMFYLGFGFFLQLVDDLQDIKEDSLHGNQTLFTLDTSINHVEEMVNRLLHFVFDLTECYQAENTFFKHFILPNCYQLIYSSVNRSKEFFSPEYLRNIETFLPVTYSYYSTIKLNKLENIDTKSQKKYMTILDELLK